MSEEPADVTSPQEGPSASEAELERLRAENAELRNEVSVLEADLPDRRRHHGRLRAVAIGVLVAVTAVTFTASTVGVWAKRSLLVEDVFAARFIPVGSLPEVQSALAPFLTDQIMGVVDPQALFEDVLPDKGKLLAVPLTSAVRGFVNDQVTRFLQSDAFVKLWTQLVIRAHAKVVQILSGDSPLVSANGNAIEINLVPVINNVLASIGQLSPQIFGRTIDVPTLTTDDIPESAKQKLENLLGKQLSPEFGVIRINSGGESLTAAQDAVKVFNILVWVLVILTLVLIPLTLFLSRRRRRTLMQLAVALLLGTVLIRRLVLGLQSELIDQVKVEANRSAVRAVSGQVVDPLISSTTIVLWVLVAIVVIALVTGPHRWAVSFRSVVSRAFTGSGAAAGSLATRARDDQTVEWVRGHTTSLQAVGVVVAVLALLVLDLSWFGVLLLLIVLGGYLVAVWWIGKEDDGRGTSSPLPPPPAESVIT